MSGRALDASGTYNTISTQSRLAQRRYSVLTSTKLTELEDKKKKLVSSGNYSEAIKMKTNIHREKQTIQNSQFNKTQFIVAKRSETLKHKTDRLMENTLMNVKMGKNRMINKKKEGESIMKIRMKSIRY